MSKNTSEQSADAYLRDTIIARRSIDAYAREVFSVISERRRRLKTFQDALCDRITDQSGQKDMDLAPVTPDPELTKLLNDPISGIV